MQINLMLMDMVMPVMMIKRVFNEFLKPKDDLGIDLGVFVLVVI